MRKLKLDVDELQVESFEAGESAALVGTVRGNMPFKLPASDDSGCGCGGSGTDHTACEQQTCNGTCAHTCANTCPAEWCTYFTLCATNIECCR